MSPLITPHNLTLRTILFYLGIAVGAILFFAYVVFQARFVIEVLEITLSNQTGTPVTNRLVTLEGTARNIVHMSLNGRQIYTDASGNFKEAIVLENGYTIATLHAEDRYGRSKNLTQAFVYVPSDTKVGNN